MDLSNPSPVFQSFTDLLGEYWWLALAFVIGHILITFWLMKRTHEYKAAERLLAEQFHVLDPIELDDMRGKLSPDQAKLWDELLGELRRTGEEPIRVAHTFWMYQVIAEDQPRQPLPKIKVPDELPYSVAHDIGLFEFRQFLLEKTEGRLVEAFRFLRTGADKSSPLCMVAYGQALVKGEVPGLAAEPAGREWFEKAIRATRGQTGVSELGWLLLEGEFLPQESDRGLALLEQGYDAGGSRLQAIDLSLIYQNGLHGVARDAAKAHEWAMKAAPRWRQILDRLGWPQTAWVRREQAELDRGRQYWANMSAIERQKNARQMLSGLRRSSARRASRTH